MNRFYSIMISALLAVSAMTPGNSHAANIDVAKFNSAFDLLIKEIIAGDSLVDAFGVAFDASQTDFLVPKFKFDVNLTARQTPWSPEKSYFEGSAWVDLGQTVLNGKMVVEIQTKTTTNQIALMNYVGRKGLERIQNGKATAVEKQYSDIFVKLSKLTKIEQLRALLLSAAQMTYDQWQDRISELETQLIQEKSQAPQDPEKIVAIQTELSNLTRSSDAMLQVKIDTVRDQAGVFQKLSITHPNPNDLLAFTGFEIQNVEGLLFEIGNQVSTIHARVTMMDKYQLFLPHINRVLDNMQEFQNGDPEAVKLMTDEARKSLSLAKQILDGEFPGETDATPAKTLLLQ